MWAWDNDIARGRAVRGEPRLHLPAPSRPRRTPPSASAPTAARPSPSRARRRPGTSGRSTRGSSRAVRRPGWIANIYGGTGGAERRRQPLIDRFGADVRVITSARSGCATFAKFNDWGPYDYHRDFNLTFPVQLMGDISYTLGMPDWFDMPPTRFGIRGTWRSLDQYSPRYCPARTPDATGRSSATPPPPATTGASGRSAPTCTWPCDGPLNRTMTTPLDAPETQQKVESLLARMNLEQKIGQMTQAERMHITPRGGAGLPHRLGAQRRRLLPRATTARGLGEMNDAYWAASMEEDESHLAIPVLYGVDAIHGHNNVRGGDGLPPQHRPRCAPTTRSDRAHRAGHRPGDSGHRCGLDVRAHPRGGPRRPLGPHLRELLRGPRDRRAPTPARFVRGLQGDLGEDRVVACAKHWVGDGGTTGGIDQGETTVTEEELRRPPHDALLAGARRRRADGDGLLQQLERQQVPRAPLPAHGGAKDELGFQGFVVPTGTASTSWTRTTPRRRARRQCRRRHVHGAREVARLHRPPARTSSEAPCRWSASMTRCAAFCASSSPTACSTGRGRPSVPGRTTPASARGSTARWPARPCGSLWCS